MRKVAVALSLACVSLALVGVLTSRSYARIDPGTVAGMWLFDEGAGAVAKDSSGNSNDGAILGPEWVDGMFGKALKFDGTDDYVDCGDNPSLDLVDHLTLVAWLKHEPGNDGYVIIRNDINDGTRQYGFIDYPGADGGDKCLDFFAHTGGSRAELRFVGTAIDDNEWHHVAFVVDNLEVKLFVDGVNKGKDKSGGLPGSMTSVETSVWIGKRKPNNFAYKGIIDEVAVFNVSLSEDDIKRIMNEGLESASAAISPAGKLATAWAVVKNQP